MKIILRLMQAMMVIVVIFSVYHLVDFFSKSRTLHTGTSVMAIDNIEPVNEKQLSGIEKNGKALFNANCASCHKIDKDITGPALMGLVDRWPDKKLLYSWIRNNQAVLKSGNKYATDLYMKWNKTAMNVFPNMTDEEITSILMYLRQYKPPQYSYEIVACL